MILTNLMPEFQRIYGLVGPVGLILCALSLLTLSLIFFKLILFMSERLGRIQPIESALGKMEAGDIEGALVILETCGPHPVAEMMRTGVVLASTGTPRIKIEAKIRSIAESRLAALSRHNRMLELIGLVAPLLGLLGTILGMIKAFQALQISGGNADPSVLAGGIWEALLTTALGMSVAIPAIVVFNLSENRIDRFRQYASSALGRFFANLEPTVPPSTSRDL